MAYVIGDYNRKGGVGKTSSIVNIAAQFALNGKKVLLVDGDSQMNLTQFFFEGNEEVFDENGEIREGVETLYEILEQDLNIYNHIKTLEFSAKRKWRNKFRKISLKLDVVLGSGDMDYYGSENTNILKEKLKLAGEEYDYIFIDFPPAHNVLTMMYLIACDYIIVPLHLAKGSSIHGYKDVIGRCREAREDYGNRELGVLGLFYINTQLYKSDQSILYEESMEEETKNAMRLFSTTIRHDYASMQTSENMQEPLCICSGSSEITKDYKTLVREMEKRIEQERGKTNG